MIDEKVTDAEGLERIASFLERFANGSLSPDASAHLRDIAKKVKDLGEGRCMFCGKNKICTQARVGESQAPCRAFTWRELRPGDLIS